MFDNVKLTRLPTEELLFLDDFGNSLEKSGVDALGAAS